MNAPQVIVIGGGYAGCMAANRVHGSGVAQVSLIDPRPHFVERIRLHQMVVGTSAATQPYDRILADGVRRITTAARDIDTDNRRVVLADGPDVHYDYLIYAPGSRSGTPTVPGAADFGHAIGDFESAQRLRNTLAAAAPNAAITVVGGGLTGIETAAEIAESHPRSSVTLVSAPMLGRSLGVRGRRRVAARLTKLGVTMVDADPVTAVSATHVTLASGAELPSAVTVWAAGFAVASLAGDSGLSTDAIGRLRVDRCLRSVDDPHIVGAGDAVHLEGVDLRMSCQSAMPLGAQAAGTVISSLRGDTPTEIDQAFAAQCLSLGRHAGTLVLTHKDDSPRGVALGGRTVALVKEQVCRTTVRLLAREAHRPGSYLWLKGGVR